MHTLAEKRLFPQEHHIVHCHSWALTCRLAAFAAPKSLADVAAIENAAIKHVYTSTLEDLVLASLFSLAEHHA